MIYIPVNVNLSQFLYNSDSCLCCRSDIVTPSLTPYDPLSLIPDHKNLSMIFYRVPISGQRLDAHSTYLISQVLHRIVLVISNRVYSISFSLLFLSM